MTLSAASALAAVAWDRPWGLGALVLPVLLLLLSLRRERPRAVPLGTIALWRDAAAGAGGARRRRRFPPARLAFAAALAAGALALAGPRRPQHEVRPLWRVVLDGGASLGLPHTDEAGVPTGRGTRLDVALAALEEARGVAGVDVEFWLDRGRGPERLGARLEVGAWREDLGRLPRVDPGAHDRPGILLLTDRAPVGRGGGGARRGGLVASGGGPVPGPISRTRESRIVWDGAALREEPAETAASLVVEGELPRILADLLELWREDRGFVAARDADGPCALRVVGGTRGAPVDARVARDGWSAAGTASRAPGPGRVPGQERKQGADLRPWLRADLGAGPVPVVTWGVGVVHVALATLEEPTGEPGAFAVSWSELFDAAARAGEDVVPLARRVAAGATVVEPPAPAPAVVRAGPDWPWSARLALAAAGLVALAVFLGEGRPAGSSLRRT